MTFVDALPTLNAALNGLSGSLLLAGWWAIRTGRRSLHWKLMAGAFTASAVFLIFYVIRFSLTGAHAFQGDGWVRPVYYAILFSHMLLAMAVVPLAVRTLWLSAVRKSYGRHRRIARWTFPIWTYVSVTGVVVYLMLYHLPA